MIDVAIPRFDRDTPTRVAGPALDKPSVFGLVATAYEEEEYHPSHAQDEEDKDEDAGAKDEFFDMEDATEGVCAAVSPLFLTQADTPPHLLLATAQ